MKLLRQSIAAAVLAGAAAFALAGDVIVLKGGTVVELREPWVRRGNTAYLTRTDGTLFSVPVTEIDRDATAAARQAAPPARPPADTPASTPADAVRVGKDGPKARVRITDADVSHPMELDPAPGEEKKEQSATNVRVEVADYTQEKNGETLLVKGSLRNPGQGPAEGVRMSVTAIDEKGQPIDGSNATLSKGTLPAGQAVDFTASLTVGDRTVASLRLFPQWNAPKPAAAPTPPPGAPAAAAGAAAAPTPVRTPYGRGTLYAAPAPSAGFQAPADGKTGYIPGPANPDQQPKPPNR